MLAVSRTKCNRVEVTVPVFHEVEVGEEDFCWALPVEGLTGSGVERPCDGVEVVLGVATEVVSLGEILA